LTQLGKLRCQQGKLAEAEDYLKRTLAAREKNLGSQHHELAFVHENLALFYRAKKQYKEAAAADRRALEIRERFYHPFCPEIADSLENLAIDLEKQGKREQVSTLRHRAEGIRKTAGEIQSTGRLPSGVLRVAITSASVDVKDESTVVATVHKGDQFDVVQVNGPWYGIVVSVRDKPQTGWVHYQDLAVATDPRRSEPITWQKISPEREHFSVEFLGTPSFSKLAVNGTEARAYEAETEELDCEVSYFDMASLTFDQAIAGYIYNNGSTVESQTTFDKTLYPGREYMLISRDGKRRRMQIILVGSHWYVVSVAGDASLLHGADAKRFFDSFTPTD
jgi:tetratricopeptide (TPR) repeat protein